MFSISSSTLILIQHGPVTSHHLQLPPDSLLLLTPAPDHPMLPPLTHSLLRASLVGGPSISSAEGSEIFCPLPPASSLPLSTAEQTRKRVQSRLVNTLKLPNSLSQILPSSSPSTRRTHLDGTPLGPLVPMHRDPFANVIQKQHISTQVLRQTRKGSLSTPPAAKKSADSFSSIPMFH